jgi:anti-sigma B factor antagonist
VANLDECPKRPLIEIDRSGRPIVIRVFGDLDWTNSGSLTTCLTGLVEGGETDIVLDLDGVPYCDSSGIGALVGAHQRLHGHLEVRQTAPEVRHVLEERGLDRVLHVT